MPQDWFAQNAPKNGQTDWFATNAPSAPTPPPSYGSEIWGGVERFAKNIASMPSQSVALMQPQNTTEQAIWPGPSPVLGALHLITGFGKGIIGAAKAGQQARKQGENWAGQTLATAENLPIAGPLVQQAEKGGTRMFSPQSVGAATEGSLYFAAPEAVSRGVPAAGKLVGKAQRAAGELFPPIPEMTGTTPSRIGELQSFPKQLEGIRQSVIGAEKNAHTAASAQFPNFDQPIQTGRMITQPAEGPVLADQWGEAAPTASVPETTTFRALQEQRSNLLKDIASENRAVNRGATPRYDLADMYRQLNSLDDLMNRAALEQGGPQGVAQLQAARQAFGKYMQDFHNPGSPLRGILDAKPGEATKVLQQFFNQNTGPRALESLRTYGVDTSPIEQMLAQGTRPLRVTAAESAKLRESGSPQAYTQRRLNEALRQTQVNELPSGAEARLPASVMQSRWPSIVGKIPGANIFNPRRITQWRLQQALKEAPQTIEAPADLQGSPTPFNSPLPFLRPQQAAPAVPQPGGLPWPTEYRNAPRALDTSGSGGANYTAEQLKAFKTKHGIGESGQVPGEDFIEQARRGGFEPQGEASAYPLNQVPVEQRPSRTIPKEQNRKIGERISGRQKK